MTNASTSKFVAASQERTWAVSSDLACAAGRVGAMMSFEVLTEGAKTS